MYWLHIGLKKAPEQDFGKERVLCVLHTYFILLTIDFLILLTDSNPLIGLCDCVCNFIYIYVINILYSLFQCTCIRYFSLCTTKVHGGTQFTLYVGTYKS